MKTTSLELSRRLAKKVAIKTENYWVDGEVWDRTMQSDYETPSTPPRNEWIPAYTTDELMEWLPALLTHNGTPVWLKVQKDTDGEYDCTYQAVVCFEQITCFESESLPEALGLLAEYLVDNGIYKGKE